jgi:glutathione S-transferase
MSETKLTLVSHHLCPYVQRAAIALAEKSIAFDRVYVDLAAKPDWFTALSPLGKVPLLIVRRPDGSEAVIFESAVICEYIEDALPGPKLHPADPLARAGHRAWMEFGSAILSDIWGLETAREEATYLAKRDALAAKFARVDAVLCAGRCCLCADLSLLLRLRCHLRHRHLRRVGEGAGLAKGSGRPRQRGQRSDIGLCTAPSRFPSRT